MLKDKFKNTQIDIKILNFSLIVGLMLPLILIYGSPTIVASAAFLLGIIFISLMAARFKSEQNRSIFRIPLWALFYILVVYIVSSLELELLCRFVLIDEFNCFNGHIKIGLSLIMFVATIISIGIGTFALATGKR